MKFAALGFVSLSFLVACGERTTVVGSQSDAGADAGPCTSRPGPVRVVFLFDQQGDMCVADPPGTGIYVAGICRQVPSGAGAIPQRIVAAEAWVSALEQSDGGGVRVLPFDTEFSSSWPLTPTGFSDPAAFDGFSDTSLTAFLQQNVPDTLWLAADYQAALNVAIARIQDDIVSEKARDPVALAATRYEVVLIGSGVPLPRCAANDMCTPPDGGTAPLDAGCGSPANPGGLWPDFAAGTCNSATGYSTPGFDAGGDWNQAWQLLSTVDQLTALKALGAGDVRLHTTLAVGTGGAQACGAVCQGSFNGLGVSGARSVGVWTLRQMAARGGGTFTDLGDPPAGASQSVDVAPLSYCAP